MQKEDWILFLVFLIVGLLLIALFFVFLGDRMFGKGKTAQNAPKIPNAQEVLTQLKDQSKDLHQLEFYSQLAFAQYAQYMQEVENFDLEFIAILTSHKSVNAKLILEVEKHFKQLNPKRKELLEKALGVGLKRR
ncbi:hypothetical protein [Helicobacter sp. MIT 05-5294]|uniref:hypothetical protein n=1 Tax=Helicobacter sp. MIT 05-5294 TaxID=1548150 RepID=UPI00051FD59E|nr:hypothetical protein [Helicobacter sp. MIT 05-5294]TLD86787.1 hypothetical protein LS69_005595 [Helicobacter sp. MIT 05-5294]